MMTNILLVLAGLACLAAVEAIYFLFRYTGERQRAELRRRLRAIDEPGGALRLERAGKLSRSRELDTWIRALPFSAQLEQLLMQTDLEWTVASMLGTAVLSGIVLFALMLALIPHAVELSVLGFFAGLGAPMVIALIVRQRRSRVLSSQLPEALDMMVRSLRAGHGVSAAFKLVATEMPIPIAVEFARCFDEHNLGVDFRVAVENMTKRVPDNLDLRIFAMSVVLQHETGGNLVEILEQIAYTIRERYKFYGKLAALTAEGKVSGVILGALPLVVTAVLGVTNGSYLSVLVESPSGRSIAMVGLLLWAAGVAWLVRLTKVEY
jgi:tight adherence protein B